MGVQGRTQLNWLWNRGWLITADIWGGGVLVKEEGHDQDRAGMVWAGAQGRGCVCRACSEDGSACSQRRAPWEAESKPGNVKWGQTLEGQGCWAESHGRNQWWWWWTWQHHWVSQKCAARAPEMPNIGSQTWTNILGSSVSKWWSHWECDLNHFLPWISYWYRCFSCNFIRHW